MPLCAHRVAEQSQLSVPPALRTTTAAAAVTAAAIAIATATISISSAAISLTATSLTLATAVSLTAASLPVATASASAAGVRPGMERGYSLLLLAQQSGRRQPLLPVWPGRDGCC